MQYPLNMTKAAAGQDPIAFALANDEAEHQSLSACGYEPKFEAEQPAEPAAKTSKKKAEQPAEPAAKTSKKKAEQPAEPAAKTSKKKAEQPAE